MANPTDIAGNAEEEEKETGMPTYMDTGKWVRSSDDVLRAAKLEVVPKQCYVATSSLHHFITQVMLSSPSVKVDAS